MASAAPFNSDVGLRPNGPRPQPPPAAISDPSATSAGPSPPGSTGLLLPRVRRGVVDVCGVTRDWRVLLSVVAVAACASFALGGCSSGVGIPVTLTPTSNDVLSQSGVSCNQNGAQVTANGTLTNISNGASVSASADLTLFDTSGNELGHRYSASKQLQPGDSYGWHMSAYVGGAKVGECRVQFLAFAGLP